MNHMILAATNLSIAEIVFHHPEYPKGMNLNKAVEVVIKDDSTEGEEGEEGEGKDREVEEEGEEMVEAQVGQGGVGEGEEEGEEDERRGGEERGEEAGSVREMDTSSKKERVENQKGSSGEEIEPIDRGEDKTG